MNEDMGFDYQACAHQLETEQRQMEEASYFHAIHSIEDYLKHHKPAFAKDVADFLKDLAA